MITFQETSDKFAVIETLYRFAAGLDLRDNDLLASAFATDATSDFRPAGKKLALNIRCWKAGKTLSPR